MEKQNTSTTMLALITGVAVGAAIGILLAPEKGSETRSQINDSIKRFGNILKNATSEGLNAFKEMKDSLYQKSGNLEDKFSETEYSGTDSKQHI